MRFTAVIVSAFLLVGNVVAASSDYGGDWLEARSYDHDLEPRWNPFKPTAECNERHRFPELMTAMKCKYSGGTAWKGQKKKCYSIEDAVRKSPNQEGQCFMPPYQGIMNILQGGQTSDSGRFHPYK
ncbi:hypothetical protein AX17_006559 [Amanita inopinata Kibby_2008]|nr:hypothetical protein AX17_006559 [Amanita inopinata Kibby_2008]